MGDDTINTTSFKGLLVWQQAIDLVETVYGLCRKLPKDELFGLSNQLRRAVVSIPSNIAEGSGRASRKEFTQHLRIAYGSLCEVETQVIIIRRLKLAHTDWESLAKQQSSVGRLLKSLIRSLTQLPALETSETSETLETYETL
jgi:four helix bundle protein